MPHDFERLIGILFTWMLIISCSTPSRYDFHQQIIQNNLSKQYIEANQFELMYVSKPGKGKSLHVYLDGDGLPWLNRNTISPDPTPRNPVALSLMTQDPANAIYLARPCYFLQRPDPKCTANLWTNARYSEIIVASMQSAIEEMSRHQAIDDIVLIGYSGGGTLAALLSERLSSAKFYVTIAANLDIKRWTEHHQFSPLVDSINPMDIELDNFKHGIHFIGGSDQIVPKQISELFIVKTKGNKVLIPRFDHTCCWVENWPELLEQISDFKNRLN